MVSALPPRQSSCINSCFMLTQQVRCPIWLQAAPLTRVMSSSASGSTHVLTNVDRF